MCKNAQCIKGKICAFLRIFEITAHILGKIPLMLSFKPTHKLENNLKKLQVAMAEKAAILESLPEEMLRYLHRYAFIANIGASTRIENAVLTDREVEWVDTTLSADDHPSAFDQRRLFITNKLSKDRERSIEEVVGCRQVLSTVYLQSKALFPLTETTIRGLHHDLLRFYPKASAYTGRYKTVPNRVVFINHDTGENRVVLDPAPPGTLTETAMADLAKWYNNTIKEYPWPILTATEFVFRFLAIHPFQDGNGRLGRALFILAFLQSDDFHYRTVAPYIALDRHIEQNRSLYYTTLHRCADGKFSPNLKNYDLQPLAWFFVKILESAIADIALYRNRYDNFQSLSESAISVLNCFRSLPEKRLAVAEITRETSIPRRTVQYALKVLTGKAFVQRMGSGAGTRYQLIF
ncbi:MAG: Fic family protein [Deltaproteobacteria bacterium]|nr:Fic family protein [Deltaproteobacteria bacterium]